MVNYSTIYRDPVSLSTVKSINILKNRLKVKKINKKLIVSKTKYGKSYNISIQYLNRKIYLSNRKIETIILLKNKVKYKNFNKKHFF